MHWKSAMLGLLIYQQQQLVPKGQQSRCQYIRSEVYQTNACRPQGDFVWVWSTSQSSCWPSLRPASISESKDCLVEYLGFHPFVNFIVVWYYLGHQCAPDGIPPILCVCFYYYIIIFFFSIFIYVVVIIILFIIKLFYIVDIDKLLMMKKKKMRILYQFLINNTIDCVFTTTINVS